MKKIPIIIKADEVLSPSTNTIFFCTPPHSTKVSFDKVYLLDDGKKVTLGAPAITGASVEAKVVSHLKGDKVIVFKKKRRKGYKVKNGHRQYLTKLEILKIDEKAAAKKAPAKKSEPKKESKTVAKKPAAKKTTTKKTAAKAE